jgi:arsenite methyltransferase
MSDIKEAVIQRYSAAAKAKEESLCCPTGYDFNELQGFIPQEVLAISYGCGTPAGLDTVQVGETVLDIGSGGGIDCFEALRRVGASGKVIGIDMTEEMLSIARSHAPRVAQNLGVPASCIEFKKGEAEALPLPDQSVDLVISNCVINLSPDKQKVFSEIYRVLKPGGRFTISDILCDSPLPQYLKRDTEKWGACLTGALDSSEYFNHIQNTGFYGLSLNKSYPWRSVDGYHFLSLTLTAHKLPQVQDPHKIAYAMLTGPFSRAIDEQHNLHLRGVSKKINASTLQLLQSKVYRPYFTVSETPLPPKTDCLQILPEPIGCAYSGDFALYVGPFLEVDDDDKHSYPRGRPLEICGRTKDVLSHPSYHQSFVLFNKAGQTISSSSCDPNSACC